jgi:squalene-hopene/tetraprenyl-beta-curcumene cyclase
LWDNFKPTQVIVSSRKLEKVMKSPSRVLALLCSPIALAIVGWGSLVNVSAAKARMWSERAAATYLDGREADWQAWDRPRKDRATLCVSCHTQASYGLARPVLHKAMNDERQSPAEQAFLASIRKRVTQWSQMQPFYSDISSGPGKEIESHNSEAVLNAFILSSYDRYSGHLSDITRTALDNAWALQSKTGPDAGSWVWQNFGFAPWESKESQYHWAALMAMAVGKAPDKYRSNPKIAENLTVLSSYLRSHYDGQPLLNKMVAFWAAESFPNMLASSQRLQLIDRVNSLQHADGGWSLTDLGPWSGRQDKTPLEMQSDGYATALIVLVREEAGAANGDSHIKRGIQWLEENQSRVTGAWTAWSLNKDRDPFSMPGHFMSDAATAYAVLALEESTPK